MGPYPPPSYISAGLLPRAPEHFRRADSLPGARSGRGMGRHRRRDRRRRAGGRTGRAGAGKRRGGGRRRRGRTG